MDWETMPGLPIYTNLYYVVTSRESLSAIFETRLRDRPTFYAYRQLECYFHPALTGCLVLVMLGPRLG